MGILKTAATVAVASSVHGRIQRRQQQRWAAQDAAAAAAAGPVPPQWAPAGPGPTAAAPAPAAAAPAPDPSERIAQLSKLAELKDAGILTDSEFEREKARILAG